MIGKSIKNKERGYILSIDQASNDAGVSLWKDGELVAVTTLKSNKKTDPFGRRVVTQIAQLDAFLDNYVGDDKINIVLFEGVKSRLVMLVAGSYLSSERFEHLRIHQKHSFVESRSWKKWARDRGASGPIKDVKGIKALKESGFPVEEYNISTDDEADSVLIYLTWRDRNG